MKPRKALFSTMASSEEETKTDIKANLESILSKVTAAYETADPAKRAAKMPRLLAVSKTKPKELVIEAYQEGHRDFGENYAKELQEKSTDPEVLEKCPDIRWHFIGKCQTSNIASHSRVKNLKMIETIDSEKFVDKLQNRFASNDLSVGIMVQVNTSGEENKNGVEPDGAVALAEHIRDKCPNLKVYIFKRYLTDYVACGIRFADRGRHDDRRVGAQRRQGARGGRQSGLSDAHRMPAEDCRGAGGCAAVS